MRLFNRIYLSIHHKTPGPRRWLVARHCPCCVITRAVNETSWSFTVNSARRNGIRIFAKGLFINDVSFFIDLHSIEYTLFYSVQVYKKADVIYERPLNILQEEGTKWGSKQPPLWLLITWTMYSKQSTLWVLKSGTFTYVNIISNVCLPDPDWASGDSSICRSWLTRHHMSYLQEIL